MDMLRKPYVAKKNIYNALNISRHFGFTCNERDFSERWAQV